jgi:hypothetical protein
MHTPITCQTTFAQLSLQLAEYELVLTRVYVDEDGYNVTLSTHEGETFALGMAPTLHEALEDAFQDVSGLAVVGEVPAVLRAS